MRRFGSEQRRNRGDAECAGLGRRRGFACLQLGCHGERPNHCFGQQCVLNLHARQPRHVSGFPDGGRHVRHARDGHADGTDPRCGTNGNDQRTPTSGQTGQALSFTGSASNVSPADNAAGYTYQWSFGDGGSATTATAGHTYAAAGSYTVTLSATNVNGSTGTTTAVVNVVVPPPVANAGPNESAPEGSAVTFAGSETSGTSPLTYSWTFGDGGTASGSLTPSHTYEQAGAYTATLTVTDALGRTSQSSDSVTVSLVAPTVTIGGPYSGTANTAIAFSGSATDPSTYDTQAGFTYQWTFGDGSTATTAAASHTYASAGTYTVTLSATDKEGSTGTASTTVNVAAVAPTVTGVTPANGATNVITGTTVTVTFSGVVDPTTVTSSTVQLLGPSSTVVSAAVSFNSTTDVATLTPTSAWRPTRRSR